MAAAHTSHRILVLHGPNLNLLGQREPDVYGTTTLDEINARLSEVAGAVGAAVDCRQSNHEGQLVDWLHEAGTGADGVVINAGAYTHTSIAIADAIASIGCPVVEVHLSNLHKRERFRQHSYLSPVCVGVVFGFGAQSYVLGLHGVLHYLTAPSGRTTAG